MNKAFNKKGKLSFSEAYGSSFLCIGKVGGYCVYVKRPILKIRRTKAPIILNDKPSYRGLSVSFSTSIPDTFDKAGFEKLDFTELRGVVCFHVGEFEASQQPYSK